MSMTIGNDHRHQPADRQRRAGVGAVGLGEALRARASSRTKARTTRMPVICSRRTRLTQSTDSCIERNCGTIRRIDQADDDAQRRDGHSHQPGQADVLAQGHEDAADHHDRRRHHASRRP